MIVISSAVNALINDYVHHLINEGITSLTRGLEKKNSIK